MTSMIMDSHAFQSATAAAAQQHHQQQQQHQTKSRNRSYNSFSSDHNSQHRSPVDHRGAVHKPLSPERSRSISNSQADRLYRLASEQSNDLHHHPDSISSAALGVQWITPQHSPQLAGFAPEPAVEPFPPWTAPTPPRSDSGIPNVSIDSNDEPVTSGINGAQEFAFDQSATSAEMSSLGFLLPSTYGPYDEPACAMDSFPPLRRSQPPSTSGPSAYAPTSSAISGLYPSRGSESSAIGRRQSDMPPSSGTSSPYAQDFRRTSDPYGNANYSMASSQTIPSISGLTQSPLPSPHMSTTSTSPYNTNMARSQNLYDPTIYNTSQPYTSSPSQQQMYAPSGAQSYPGPQQTSFGSAVNEVLSKPSAAPSSGGSSSSAADQSIRVLNQRPKPQCWEHGCNGRQFSTFSNLLRHQREKSGTAAKSYCPKCGAEFTRTTARNGHLAHDKCTKQRRPSEGI